MCFMDVVIHLLYMEHLALVRKLMRIGLVVPLLRDSVSRFISDVLRPAYGFVYRQVALFKSKIQLFIIKYESELK